MCDERWSLVAPYLALLREDDGQCGFACHVSHEQSMFLRFLVRYYVVPAPVSVQFLLNHTRNEFHLATTAQNLRKLAKLLPNGLQVTGDLKRRAYVIPPVVFAAAATPLFQQNRRKTEVYKGPYILKDSINLYATAS